MQRRDQGQEVEASFLRARHHQLPGGRVQRHVDQARAELRPGEAVSRHQKARQEQGGGQELQEEEDGHY